MKQPYPMLSGVLAAMTLAACDSPQEKPEQAEALPSRQLSPAPKPAYIIFTREKTLNQAELEIYWSKVTASLEGHPMKVLSGYGAHEVLEGDPTEGVVVAEFPSMEAAKAWYHSPAYQEAREHRFKGAAYRGILVESTTP